MFKASYCVSIPFLYNHFEALSTPQTLSSLTPGARRKDPYTGLHTIDGRSYVPPVEDGFRIGVKRLASGIVRTVGRGPSARLMYSRSLLWGFLVPFYLAYRLEGGLPAQLERRCQFSTILPIKSS